MLAGMLSLRASSVILTCKKLLRTMTLRTMTLLTSLKLLHCVHSV